MRELSLNEIEVVSGAGLPLVGVLFIARGVTLAGRAMSSSAGVGAATGAAAHAGSTIASGGEHRLRDYAIQAGAGAFGGKVASFLGGKSTPAATLGAFVSATLGTTATKVADNYNTKK